MSTTITSECINCGACEPECPNTAIYAGGIEWELSGAVSPAIAQDIFYIVPAKCTECVGFHDHEACAAVCPVDCCVPDPANPETEAVLLARARELHPKRLSPTMRPRAFAKRAAKPRLPRHHPRMQRLPYQRQNQLRRRRRLRPSLARLRQSRRLRMRGSAKSSIRSRGKYRLCARIATKRFASRTDIFRRVWFFIARRARAHMCRNPRWRGKCRETFEKFYARRRAEQEATLRRQQREQEIFAARQAAEMTEFKKRVTELGREMKPAGKLVRPKGISAMFS